MVRAELEDRGAWQEDWQHTFSACFEEPSLDERPYIQAVAQATGCRTHFVFPCGERLSEEIDTWIWHQDEPAFSTNIYAHFSDNHRPRILPLHIDMPEDIFG